MFFEYAFPMIRVSNLGFQHLCSIRLLNKCLRERTLPTTLGGESVDGLRNVGRSQRGGLHEKAWPHPSIHVIRRVRATRTTGKWHNSWAESVAGLIAEPISARSRTDFNAQSDRFQCGTRPISRVEPTEPAELGGVGELGGVVLGCVASNRSC